MPNYKWSGINLYGNVVKGKNYAFSVEDLHSELLQNDISLLNANSYSPKFLYINKKNVRHFFSQLSKLVNSGIRIFKALEIIYPDTKDKKFKNIIKSLKSNISHGSTLAQALRKHAGTFDHVSIALIESGSNTGKIGPALELVNNRLSTINDFSKKLKSALLMPFITIIFFLIITLSIFIFVIPRFETIFQMFQHPLPASTKVILNISNFLRKINLIYTGLLIAGFALVFVKFKSKKTVKLKTHKFLIVFPLTKKFVIQLNSYFFLNCLSLLLKAGINLTNALKISKEAVANVHLQNEIDKIVTSLEDGKSFSDSIKASIFSSNEFYTMITVGQESGNLSGSIFNTSSFYQDKIYQKLNFWISIIQPLLLIFMGLFIATLIYSVYVPIFTLSNVIS